MVTIVAPKFTYRDLCEMPDDGKRYQLIDGELYVTPSPNRAHQRAVGNLYAMLRARIQGPGLGEVYLAPFDVVFDEMNVVQPDLLVISNERLADRHRGQRRGRSRHRDRSPFAEQQAV